MSVKKSVHIYSRLFLHSLDEDIALETMNCLSNRSEIIELLDLPDEMILGIMHRVEPRALLLCSIIHIGNDRLEQLALDKYDSIDLSFAYAYSPYELLLMRFFSDVLPTIYNNIQTLKISLRHLLRLHAAVKAIDSQILPNLRHLNISAGRRRHYTGTPFTISFYDDSESHYFPLFSTVPQSVYIEGKLINPVLSVIGGSPLMRSINSFEFDHNAALLVSDKNVKLFGQSSNLTHVSITLRILSDCVRLLNQLGSQLHSFTVSIVHSYRDDEDIMPEIESVFCCNLRRLTMTIYRNILNYEEGILPLLQHLSSVEYLTLFLAVGRTGSNRFIDGFHLERNIVSYMPHLRQFDFHIRSILPNASYIEVDTIRQSFTGKQSVDCTLDYFNNQYGQCQIYSLPFIGNRLEFISNRFPLFDNKQTFENVTMLLLFDNIKPFENIFFERVTRAIPRLQTLEVFNQLEQEENTEPTRNPIEFCHLSTLILHKIHMDYGEQLLCRARLPRLVELVICDEVLIAIIDQDNAQARYNCSKVETLFIVEPWIERTSFHLQFFPKLCMTDS